MHDPPPPPPGGPLQELFIDLSEGVSGALELCEPFTHSLLIKQAGGPLRIKGMMSGEEIAVSMLCLLCRQMLGGGGGGGGGVCV